MPVFFDHRDVRSSSGLLLRRARSGVLFCPWRRPYDGFPVFQAGQDRRLSRRWCDRRPVPRLKARRGYRRQMMCDAPWKPIPNAGADPPSRASPVVPLSQGPPAQLTIAPPWAILCAGPSSAKRRPSFRAPASSRPADRRVPSGYRFPPLAAGGPLISLMHAGHIDVADVSASL